MAAQSTERGRRSPGAHGSRPLIFFDGECNLCNCTVLWVIRRDTRRDESGRIGCFDFASLHSRAAEEVLEQVGAGPSLPDSIVVIDGAKVLVKSDAGLAIGRRLRFPWPLLARIGAIVPRRLRDAIYDWVARHRHQWFGRGACIVPTPELESRFLDAAERRTSRPVEAATRP